MNLGYFSYPLPPNEKVLDYAPGSPETSAMKAVLKELKSAQADIPMYIGGEEVRSGIESPSIRRTNEHMYWVIIMQGRKNMLRSRLKQQ